MSSIVLRDFSKAARQKKIFFFFLIYFSVKGWNFVRRPLNDPKGRKTLSRIAAIAGWRESCFSTDILQYLITSWRFCWTKGRTYLQRWKMHPLKEGYRKISEYGWKNAIESLIKRWDYERISGKHAVTPMGRSTPYNGLYRDSPPERATFCRRLRKGRVINVDWSI